MRRHHPGNRENVGQMEGKMGWGRQAGFGSAVSTLRARGKLQNSFELGSDIINDIHSLGAHPGKSCLNFLVFLTVESSSCCLALISP